MHTASDWRITRRKLLQAGGTGPLALSLGIESAAAEDHRAVHNMLMFGDKAEFLSHLPMFDSLSDDGSEFNSPHRYQVIVEAAFTEEQQDIYRMDRRAHPNTPFYTVGPEPFVLSRLFTPAGAPQLTSFTGTVFRGHLEVVPKHPVRGLQNIQIKVARVAHGRQFDPRAAKPAALEYLLFGRGQERYLAHAIFAPPDFDHVLSARVTGVELTDRELNQGLRIAVPNRKNVVADRLRKGQRVEASLAGGASAPAKVQLEIESQIYFEEGELLMPPTFDPTDEEKRG